MSAKKPTATRETAWEALMTLEDVQRYLAKSGRPSGRLGEVASRVRAAAERLSAELGAQEVVL